QADGTHSVLRIREMKHLAETSGNQQFEWMFKKEDGTLSWIDIMMTSIILNEREILYVVCKDISKRKEMEKELSQQKNALHYRANHDALTGLPNRTFFIHKLKEALSQGRQNDEEFVLMFIDLDRFKKINDSLGHAVGDAVIKTISERLKLLAGKENFVARLGGDEFVLFMKNVKNDTEILTLVTQILSGLKEEVSVEHYTLYTSASIGISRYAHYDTNADNLLKYADTAMYKAKEMGGNSYCFYTKEMTELAYEHVMMEKDLREGIKSGDFEVYYQPQVNGKTGEITGLEALVRWHHPVEGLLAPDSFIALAEKTGIIVELDLWVMEQAMKDVSRWYKAGLTPGVLALNISMRQLEYPYLQEVVQEHMERYDFKAEWLEFEVTETAMMKKPEKVIDILDGLHALGIVIAIDDFGTGYSSLSHLKRLPIDKLKIDQSFIKDIPEDSTAKTIVNTMIVLAESLHLEVIAEGVETEAQHNFLLENGCSQIQGHYYSEAVTAREIEAILKTQSDYEEKLLSNFAAEPA
ncbi:MAG: EAL domain-containing protein, partial [Sulfurovum sp.]|nr:EAL domain-containing protein [Sulfurovum sp.]